MQEIEETMYIDERKKALNAALEQLPADMRAAVHLVYLEEMSYAQAARVMKKVKSRSTICCIAQKKSFAAFSVRIRSCLNERVTGIQSGDLSPQLDPHRPAKKTEKTGRDPLYRMHVVRDLCATVSANRVPDRENGHPRF